MTEGFDRICVYPLIHPIVSHSLGFIEFSLSLSLSLSLSYTLFPSVSLYPSLNPSLTAGGFCLCGQGRDGLDWHRLVLGGRRVVVVGVLGHPCGRFTVWRGRGGGGVADGWWSWDPHSRSRAGLHLSNSTRWGGETVEHKVFVCRCVTGCIPWFLFQEKLTLKCPERFLWMWFTASAHTHKLLW